MSSDSENGSRAESGQKSAGPLAWIAGLFGERNASVRDSIEDALDEADPATGQLTIKERAMLRNVLGLRDSRIEDVMVPRADIAAVDANDRLDLIIKVFRDGGHSRLPVYRETLDDPLGMIHIKDVLGLIATQASAGKRKRKDADAVPFDMQRVDLSVTPGKAKLLREVLYVPPSMPAVELMVKMQTTRVHMALVVDEYGGTDGLVTIEDLVEEIVGEIEDEHDEQSGPPIVSAGNGVFVADARASLEDLHMALGNEIVPADILEEVDTVGGLVFHRAGRVPVRGELVEVADGIEIEVLEADPRRMKRVKIYRRAPGEVRKSRRTRRAAPKSDNV